MTLPYLGGFVHNTHYEISWHGKKLLLEFSIVMFSDFEKKSLIVGLGFVTARSIPIILYFNAMQIIRQKFFFL